MAFRLAWKGKAESSWFFHWTKHETTVPTERDAKYEVALLEFIHPDREYTFLPADPPDKKAPVFCTELT
jgi:hypothetical protein